jgi:hypothetical protein
MAFYNNSDLSFKVDEKQLETLVDNYGVDNDVAAVSRVRRVFRDIGVPERFREWERAARAHSLAEIDSIVDATAGPRGRGIEPEVAHALKIFFEEPFLALTGRHFQTLSSLVASKQQA